MEPGRPSGAPKSLSHELRNPLNAIIGFADLLQEETAGPLTERQRLYVRNILTSAQALFDRINRLDDREAGSPS